MLSSIHHRDQARLYAKQVRGGQGELELSPEEAEAVRLALEGEPRLIAPPPDADRLPRPRGHVQRRGAAGTAGEASRRAVPFPTIPDTVLAVHDGAVDRALVPIENSLEGAVNATLDALAVETEDVRSWARSCTRSATA